MNRSVPRLLVLALVAGAAIAPSAGAQDTSVEVRRISGTSRILTAIALSREVFDGGTADAVVVAYDARFPDALAAAPLAAAANGPVLLNPREALDREVRDEIARLGANTAYLMGGESAQSAVVEAQLEQVVDEVVRVRGDDRFETAAAAAREAARLWRTGGDAAAGRHVLVALGEHPTDESRAWPDALASGALAGYAHRPILLTRQGDVPRATDEAIEDLGVTDITVVGGEGAIPSSTAGQLGDGDEEQHRIGGTTRYDTSVLLAQESTRFGAGEAEVFAATGNNFPDGLAAGPAAWKREASLVLVDGRDLDNSADTRRYFSARRGVVGWVGVAGGPAAVSDTVLGQIRATLTELHLRTVTIATGLDRPVYAITAPGDDRIFIVEKPGRIRILDGGALQATPFLDITDRVNDSGNEQGLLGLAFHPGYADNGRFFVYHSIEGSTDLRLAEYQVSLDGDVADRGSERVILDIDHFGDNHNGGMLTFGADGMLWLGVGDGGGGGDPEENGQNTNTLLGKILRLDVDGGGTYAIPPDNPFANGGGAPEVWAYGLRNPWRFALDAPEGLIYIGDVGQGSWEEIDVVSSGAGGHNFGWDSMEGSDCFEPSSGCDRSGKVLPVLQYENGTGGCAVTGGFVYRGEALPELTGHYFYSDYCTRFVRSFRYRDGVATDERDWTAELGELGAVTSFGLDARGELLIVADSGEVHRIERAG